MAEQGYTHNTPEISAESKHGLIGFQPETGYNQSPFTASNVPNLVGDPAEFHSVEGDRQPVSPHTFFEGARPSSSTTPNPVGSEYPKATPDLPKP